MLEGASTPAMAQPNMLPMAAKVGQPVEVKKLRQEKAHHQKRNTTFQLALAMWESITVPSVENYWDYLLDIFTR